jgi:23S rRNA (uracil1939-C5)-methyltransferase
VAGEQTEVFLKKAKTPPDFVLADPPRAGLGSAAAARLAELRPPALAIVACDPATLARDLAALLPVYAIERITMVDLFPQTFHLETIVRLGLK